MGFREDLWSWPELFEDKSTLKVFGIIFKIWLTNINSTLSLVVDIRY